MPELTAEIGQARDRITRMLAGRPGEAFLHGAKVGSDSDGLHSDIGVLPKTLVTLLAIALSPQPEGAEPIDPTWRPQWAGWSAILMNGRRASLTARRRGAAASLAGNQPHTL